MQAELKHIDHLHHSRGCLSQSVSIFNRIELHDLLIMLQIDRLLLNTLAFNLEERSTLTFILFFLCRTLAFKWGGHLLIIVFVVAVAVGEGTVGGSEGIGHRFALSWGGLCRSTGIGGLVGRAVWRGTAAILCFLADLLEVLTGRKSAVIQMIEVESEYERVERFE
jgi:hypothetical protein